MAISGTGKGGSVPTGSPLPKPVVAKPKPVPVTKVYKGAASQSEGEGNSNQLALAAAARLAGIHNNPPVGSPIFTGNPPIIPVPPAGNRNPIVRRPTNATPTPPRIPSLLPPPLPIPP